MTRIERGELRHAVEAKRLKKGAAVQTLSVRVANRTPRALSTAGGSASVSYGSTDKTAPTVPGKHDPSTWGSIPAGATRTARFTFAVPKRYLNQASLTVGLDATHQLAVFTGSLDFSPGNGVVFNDPNGSKADQLRIIKHIDRAIDAAPKGSTIRMALYGFDIDSTTKKLVAAHQRGVGVQILVDRHKRYAAMPWEEFRTSPQVRRLRGEIGSRTSENSFVTMCKASCMSNRRSAMHAKFYLFSQVGGSHLVTMVSSANITHTNSKGSWNNLHTVVDNQRLHHSLTRYFNDMLKDKSHRNYYRTTTSGKYKLYLFPRETKNPNGAATLLHVLDDVSCRGAARDYGSAGRTVIQIAVYSWAGSRVDLAEKVWALHDTGCKMEVIYNSGRTSSQVKNVLFRRSDDHGLMPIYDAWIDHDLNDRPSRYMHHKAMIISGVLAGRRNTKIVYTGSQNFTGNATTDNNDIILRITDDTIYDAYSTNFTYIQKQSPKWRW